MPTGDDHLKAWLSAFLGGDERLQWELTNVRTGVTRRHDGDEQTVEPAADLGAVAAVTDRRVLFLVGGAADDGRDHVASVPHEEIAGVEVVEDLLTAQLVLTTGAGATWEFTAREAADLAEVASYLEEVMPGTGHVERALATARECRDDAAAESDAAARAEQYDEAIEAYRRAVELRMAPAVDTEVDAGRLREEVLATVEAGIEASVEWAREARSRGNWELGAGDDALAYRHFSTAVDAFDRAAELARQSPPGDPEAITAERADLVAKLDDLDIRTPVMTGDD